MGKAKQLAILQSAGFSLIAVDTGILRTLDDKHLQWLEAALHRAGNNFKFVYLGASLLCGRSRSGWRHP